jgi:hypothetical protein
MAAFGMYGAEASPGRLYEQDQQQAALRRAQTRQLEAAATQTEMEVEGQRRFMTAMEKAANEAPKGEKPSVSMADTMERAAQAAMSAGAHSEATKLATNAALIRQRESAVVENKAQEQKAVLDLQVKRLDALSRIMGGVQDQETWDEANAIYAKTFGEVSPYAGQPYDQSLIDRLKGATTTAAQRARLALQEADNTSKGRNRKSAAEFREFRKGIMEQDAQLKRDREERVKKTTGTEGDKGPAVGTPTGSEIAEATRILKESYPNWPKEELKSAAFAMASRARGLRRANRALEPDEALGRAFEEAKTSGAYEVIEGLFKDGTKFKRDKLATTPLTGPKPAVKSLPPGARQIGTSKGKPVYETPDGKRFIAE